MMLTSARSYGKGRVRVMSLAHADPAAAGARPAVTADAVLDAALTLFAERGYHGRHAVSAQPGRDPNISARGVPDWATF